MMTEGQFFKHKRFLIVDDFEPIRSSVRGMLQALGGIDIHAAASGQRALTLCQKQSFDFIVCDYNLGEGKDGYQFFEELKIRKLLPPDGVFIMISAETRRQQVHGLLELQPDDYLLKPFTYKTLERRLLRAFYKKRITREVYRQLEAGNTALALRECERIEADTPSLKLTVDRLKGEVLMRAQQFKQAEALYLETVKVRAYGWAALGLAICWVSMARWQPAQRLLLELLERDDTRLEAYDWLAIVSLQSGLPSQALDYLQQAIRLSPRNLKRQQALARIARLLGEHDVAHNAWQQVIRLARFSVHDSPCHHIAGARCLLDHLGEEAGVADKLLPRVLSLLNDAQRRYGADSLGPASEILLARVDVAKGEVESAHNRLRDLLKDSDLPTDPDERLDLARVWFAIGQQPQAKQLLDQLADGEPAGLQLLSQAEAVLLKQQVGRQRKLAERLLELNDRGLKLYQNGLFEAATDTFLEAYELMPTHPVVALNLLQALTKKGGDNHRLERIRAICQACLKVVEAAALDEEQQQRYHWIKPEIEKLTVGR